MTLEINQNTAEADRLEQENILMERQAAQNREMYNRRIKEILAQLTEAKQHVEEQVGLVQTMASKEVEDAEQQKNHVRQVVAADNAAELQRRNDPENFDPVPERDLIFSQ